LGAVLKLHLPSAPFTQPHVGGSDHDRGSQRDPHHNGTRMSRCGWCCNQLPATGSVAGPVVLLCNLPKLPKLIIM
jgi:hypothetical protein